MKTIFEISLKTTSVLNLLFNATTLLTMSVYSSAKIVLSVRITKSTSKSEEKLRPNTRKSKLIKIALRQLKLIFL